ncbi:MAG TPA: phasin family protein [Steroidobacteraceae bacterium]|nr:phasin family protein [Steroidobacteraceae bacterium]
MARKTKARKSTRGNGAASAQERMLNAVHQIWLAGLGAASKAQRGAPPLFENLVSEGARVHAQTRGAAEKALRGVVGDVQERINSSLGQVRGQAEETMANLEKMFQTRVHRALIQLGIPSAEEIEALSKRVDNLNANIGRLARSRKPHAGARAHAGRKASSARAVVS